jgi:two-component system, LuxR family, response regulator FixJ
MTGDDGFRGLVHIVDDDVGVLDAVAFLVGAAGYDARCYASGVEFVAQLAPCVEGCLLLDLQMPGLGGFDVLAALAARSCQVPTVVLTGHGDTASAVAAMKAGAVDFLEKPYQPEVLLAAIDRAFADPRRGRHNAGVNARARIATLTPREHQILDLLAEGHSNKSIGLKLGVSPRTVEMHRAHVMTKLGVRTLADTLRLVFEARLLD